MSRRARRPAALALFFAVTRDELGHRSVMIFITPGEGTQHRAS
ncbi:hypothetical protein SCE1572_19870 [Sorangium cellulosum So0157-2]|uniref:Uncharacterized protein n=1 Tax=Sorangium cellulosum So0157-2 TaxID=1254432 RepID=S4XVP4_SORCE|nr:hypothetical protein SCE1572_19870 [Sorangium cellulosum So0157-2]